MHASSPRVITYVIQSVLLAVVAAATWAAPILPQRPVLSDEIRGNGQGDFVDLGHAALPPELTRAGVTEQQLKQLMRDSLLAAKIDVVDDPEGTPRLVLHTMVLTDPEVPDAAGLIFFLDVQQEVDIPRLHQTMTVPTTTVLGAAQTPRAKLAQAAQQRCLQAVEQFIHIVRTATANS